MTQENDPFGLVGIILERKYRIDAVVGEGGFGVVYRGFHLAFQHEIAVKCLKIPHELSREAQEQFVTRFREEGQHLSRLASANMAIVRVFDFDIVASPSGVTLPYLVLEWLRGRTLDAVLEERRVRGPARFDEREAIALLRPAVEALGVAHGLGIVHRDVKPANLFVVDGNGPPSRPGGTLKVLDFGIAKVMQAGDTAAAAPASTRGFGAFSARHGAPEQFSALQFGATGPWTDVHALGLLLVELVAGAPAFTAEAFGDLFAEATSVVRPTPRARGAIVSDDLEAICARALALAPADRFPNAHELLRALDAAAADGMAVFPATVGNPQASYGYPAAPHPYPAAAAPFGPWTPSPAGSGTQVAFAPAPPDIVMSASGAPVPQVWQGTPRPAVAPTIRPAARSGGAIAWVVVGVLSFLGLLGAGAAWGTWRYLGSLARKDCDRGDVKACRSACDDHGESAGCAMLGRRLLIGSGIDKDEKKAVALLRTACDSEGGTGASGCGGLGYAYERGRGGATKDEKRAVELYQHGCDSEELNACVLLASAIERTIGGLAKDEKRAVELYQKACDANVLQGCSFLGVAHEKGNGGLAKDSGRAIALYKRACDGGDMRGCNGLGFAYERGLGGLTKDPKHAVELYQRACDGGEMRGCTNVGYAYEYAIGGLPKDDKRAVELYQRSCEADDAGGCTNLGVYVERGLGGMVKDDRRAVELYKRGCDGGAPVACNNLGFSYERATGGLVKDTKHAAELYARACDDACMDGCNNLAVYLEHGEGGVKDEKRAVELYRRACEANDMLACSNLGYQFENARGGLSKDVDQAVELYKRACDGGNIDGCGRLGVAYELGKGALPKDMTRAVPLYHLACDGGAMLSCSNLGLAYQHGRGVTADPKKAVELYKRACDGGAVNGCANLGFAYEHALGGLVPDAKRSAELYKRACDGGNTWSCDALKRQSGGPALPPKRK